MQAWEGVHRRPWVPPYQHGYSRSNAPHVLREHRATSTENRKHFTNFSSKPLLSGIFTLDLKVESFCDKYSSILWSALPRL